MLSSRQFRSNRPRERSHIASCSSLLCVLRVLRQHGMPNTSLQDVFRSTVMSKMLYCCQAWSGFCSTADRQRLDSFIRHCIKLGYCAPDTPPIETLFTEADENLLWTHAQRCVHVMFYRCFFLFYMAALVGQTAERIFTKLSHVVDIRCYLRTY